jgi:thiol-disulfide isomerase/thioredoxin
MSQSEASSPQPAPRILPWIALLVIAAAAYMLYSRGNPRGGPRPGAIGRPANLNWQVADLQGNGVPLDRYKGRAVFLNIWATWCPPCVGELPLIARLAATPALQDAAFLCVSVDEEPETVQDFLARRDAKLPMTFLHAARGLPADYQTDGIPATFILSPDGTIAFEQVGMLDDGQIPELANLIQNLIRSAPKANAEAPAE